MTLPISISYQGLPPSPALNSDIERHALRLERFASRLQSCHVTVRRGERRRGKSRHFVVTVQAGLPGATFTAGGKPVHKDVYVAAHHAIDALRRQLEDFVDARRENSQSRESGA